MKSVVIFGAGNRGRQLAKILIKKGRTVLGFLDTKTIGDESLEGLPVKNPDNTSSVEAWIKLQPEIIIAVFNPQASMPDIMNMLTRKGFESVTSFYDCYRMLAKESGDIYWLSAQADIYQKNQESITSVRNLLRDEKSRFVFDQILRFRHSLDLCDLPARDDISEQYFPHDVPLPRDKVHFIDCGAYDGDTSLALRRYFREVKGFDCFEPDPVNYRKMIARLELVYDQQPVLRRYHPNGLAEKRHVMHFQQQGTGGFLSPSGGVEVECVTIDEKIPDRIDHGYLKMDIEGSELDALKGAKRMLLNNRINVAICVYHKAEHLWQIPLFLHSLHRDYVFYLRHYAHNGFETVLYGIRN